jgi:hypothetical protein
MQMPHAEACRTCNVTIACSNEAPQARALPLLQGGDELLEGRRISMSPEAVPAYDVDVLVGSAAREAGSLLQVLLVLCGGSTPLVADHGVSIASASHLKPLHHHSSHTGSP